MLHSRCAGGRKFTCPNKPIEDKYLGLVDLSNRQLTKLPDELVENSEEIHHLILDGNELDESVFKVADFENLRTLSLNSNNVKNIGVLVHYLSRKCPNLTFLSLIGNPGWPHPIHNFDMKIYKVYVKSVTKLLPNLMFLDSMPVTRNLKKTPHQ